MGEIKRIFVHHFFHVKNRTLHVRNSSSFKNKRKIRLFNFSCFIFSFKELNFFLSLFSQLKARKLRQRVTQRETETGIQGVETGIDLLETFEFFVCNTKLLQKWQYWHQMILQQQKNLQWGSTWWSLDKGPNAYPSELTWHVLASLRLLDPCIIMLLLGESSKSKKWRGQKSQFKDPLTSTRHASSIG